jgi:lipid A oxidase
MARSIGVLTTLALVVALIVTVASPKAHAEIQVSAYAGGSLSFDSDVDLNEAGSSTTFNDVSWDAENFKLPPHWGVRGTWWIDAYPNWGVSIDFTHAKVKANPLPSAFQKLEFTDGINIVTANAMYRYPTGTRFTPYGGLGLGMSIPHVEVKTANSDTFEYQLAGIAAQGVLGVDLMVWNGISVFGEYKLSYTQNDTDLNGSGSLDTNIWTNHVDLGLAYKF